MKPVDAVRHYNAVGDVGVDLERDVATFRRGLGHVSDCRNFTFLNGDGLDVCLALVVVGIHEDLALDNICRCDEDITGGPTGLGNLG